MQKILLISFMSFLFFNVYSQNSTNNSEKNIKDQYKSQKTTDEKLDFIFYQIFDKQISNFNKLKKDFDKLKKDFDQLKDEQYNDLQSKNIELNKIKKEKSKITEKISKFEVDEKTRVEKEINEIFKSEEIISDKLLKMILTRATLYNIDKRKIDDLNVLINYSKKIRDAENLLSKEVNKSKIKSQLKLLREIDKSKFNLNKKINTIILLLENYCQTSQDLYEELKLLDDVRKAYSDDRFKFELEKKKKLVISFPYLLAEINKKINNLNYKSSVKQCY